MYSTLSRDGALHKLELGEKQSWSPLQELLVGTGFVEFRQLQEVGVFSYLLYSLAKSHLNCSDGVRP